MANQSISITRALVEIKRLDTKLAQMGNQSTFVAVTVGRNNNLKVHGSSESVKDVARNIQATFDTIEALQANRRKLKAALVLSNATTKVKIGNQEMSVAEAIELKGTIANKQHLLYQMQSALTRANSAVNTLNDQLAASIDKSLQAVYGNEKGKVDESQYAAIAKPQLEQKEAALLDPAGIQKKITDLQNEVELLTSELDFVLSESNSRTMIEVDLTTVS